MNNSVEALILLNEGHQSLLKLHVHFGVVEGFSMGGKGDCVILYCFREDQCQQVFTKEKWRKRQRRPNIVIFVVWGALNVDCWVVVGWGRESCLGPTEISSLCSWFNSRMGTQAESKISSFVSDMNQETEEFEYKRVHSRFYIEAPGMERFSQDLLQTVRRENVLWKRLWVGVDFVVTGQSKVKKYFWLFKLI